MIRLASLASWAARKTCIKGVLRRECRFGLSIQPQSQGGDPSLEHAGNSGDRFFRKTVLEKSERVDGGHPLVALVSMVTAVTPSCVPAGHTRIRPRSRHCPRCL